MKTDLKVLLLVKAYFIGQAISGLCLNRGMDAEGVDFVVGRANVIADKAMLKLASGIVDVKGDTPPEKEEETSSS